MNDRKVNSIVIQLSQTAQAIFEEKVVREDVVLLTLDQPSAEKDLEDINIHIFGPAIKLAKEIDSNLIITANNSSTKFGVAIRKSAKEKFTILTPQQIAILVADSLFPENLDKPQKNKRILLKSVLLPELLEKFVVKRGGKVVDSLPGQENLLSNFEVLKENDVAMAADEFNNIVLNPADDMENLVMVLENLLEKVDELKSRELSLFDYLLEVYCKFGFNKQKTFSVDLVDQSKKKFYQSLFKSFKTKPPKTLADFKIRKVTDFKKQTSKNLLTGKETIKKLPSGSILSLFLDKGAKVMMMPTDDKMYFHVSMSTTMSKQDQYTRENNLMNENFLKIISGLGNYKLA